jgi:hypothetical protein
VVVHDAATNSLLIAAGKTRYEEVLDLIQKLDKRQDQVLIETALVALTGQDFRDIGVELAGADVMGDGGFGITSFGLSSIIDTDDDGVPDTRTPNVANGVTAGLLDGDNINLPILLAAVDRLDESNVLNVPSVLVNNNRTATVRTLDEQPTTTITATGGVQRADPGELRPLRGGGHHAHDHPLDQRRQLPAPRHQPPGVDLLRGLPGRDPAPAHHARDRDDGQRARRGHDGHRRHHHRQPEPHAPGRALPQGPAADRDRLPARLDHGQPDDALLLRHPAHPAGRQLRRPR